MVLRSCDCLEPFRDRNLILALIAEFLGAALFQFFGGSLAISNIRAPDWGDPTTVAILAIGNGLIFAILVFLTRHVSGGHLNPSITLAVTVSGHMNVLRGVMYIIIQLLGSCAGAAAAHLSLGGGTYCYNNPDGSSNAVWELFSWEIVMTFVLIMVVYSSVIAPGHGDVGPLAIGFTITGLMWAGVSHSGGAMNPARVVAPLLVNSKGFDCSVKVMWYYISAQAVAGILAALAAMIIHGHGPHYTVSTPSDSEEPLVHDREV